MEKQEQIKTVSGIVLLYTIIISIFSFIDRLSTMMFLQSNLNLRINSFLQRNTLWIVVVAIIIIILTMYIKKLNQGVYFNVINNSVIRVTAGALAILEGIISSSSLLPLSIMSIKSAIQTMQVIQQNGQMITKVVISNVISVVIILCQILFGIYLVKFHRTRTN